MNKVKLLLVIERGEDSKLSGRVNYNNNLIVDFADTTKQLESKIKYLLHDLEGLDQDQIQFEHQYDVYALFEKFDFLNITKIAKYAEINPVLLRQYSSGVKHPSAAQEKKIESTLHILADEMQ